MPSQAAIKTGQKGISPFLAVLSGLLSGSLVCAQIVLFTPVGARQDETLDTSAKGNEFRISQSLAVGLNRRLTDENSGEFIRPSMHAAPSGKFSNFLSVVDHSDITETHRLLADSTLRALPFACRTTLKNFYVDYKKPNRRGWGGATTMIIDGGVAAEEFRALIVHECGHIIDLGYFRGTTDAGLSGFFDGNEPIFGNDVSVSFYRIDWLTEKTRLPNTDASHFVSGYAMSDPFEDFAETFAFFILQREAFARLSHANRILKAKYNWMAQNIFMNTRQVTASQYVQKLSPPWDVTKLHYVWLE